MSRLAHQLEIARRRRFVGRADELALFDKVFETQPFPFHVLYVYGPGGVGKTTLLREYIFRARQQAFRAIYVDGRNVESAPNLFQAAVCQALETDPGNDPIECLIRLEGPTLLVIDTYENLTALDGWIREEWLPRVPDKVITILAGRNPPTLAWRSDPGWHELLHVLPLRNLSTEDSRIYLQKRAVPDDQQATVLNFAHGHPLALSLIADLFAQRPDLQFEPSSDPDMIKLLLEHFVQETPSPRHRLALEACAMVHLMTESLLEVMLDTDDAHEEFRWLRDLSFMENRRQGLFPHDLAREALTVDVRWRNPERYAELHRRARKYYMSRLTWGDSHEQRQNISDYVYLHRDNPMVRPFMTWQQEGIVFTDQLRPGDEPYLYAMVERHEGKNSAELAAYWRNRQPDGAIVLRGGGEDPQGYLQWIALGQITGEDAARDPIVGKVSRFIQQHVPLREGDSATLFRFWMARDTYQAVSPVQSRIFINMLQHYLTASGLVYTFILCADPDFWAPMFAYGDLTHLKEMNYVSEGRAFGVYGRNWRPSPPLEWLALMAERELATQFTPPRPAETVFMLSQSDFEQAIRDALRAYTDLVALRSNPLLRSRLVLAQTGEDERVATLRHILRDSAETLQSSPRQQKLYRALYHTYFQPAATQEQAAELLDLPFSTYRRHLRAGITYVTEHLWARELGLTEA